MYVPVDILSNVKAVIGILQLKKNCVCIVKFMIDEIFTIDLTLCSKCQIDGEDFVNFCGLLRKHEL